MTSSKLVHLYPNPDAHLYPWPSVELDVTPEEAEVLLGYLPPPFSTDPPPEQAAAKPRGPVEETGPSDSPEGTP